MNRLALEVPRYGTGVPGLPDHAIVITNSERTQAACPSRWLFGGPDRLKPQGRARPLAWGSAWHEWLEDVHRWWMDTDTLWVAGSGFVCAWCAGNGLGGSCTRCEGTGHGPLTRTLAAWIEYAEADATGEYTTDQAEADHDRLVRCAEGWLHTYGTSPPEGHRVVGVEMTMAVPIMSPGGTPYAPHTWVVPDDDPNNLGGLRIAGTGEANAPGAYTVRWPWYQALTLDLLLQNRSTGGLWVGEHKSAASPTQRVGSVIVDPQLAGYMWAAQVAISNGTLDHLGLPRASRVHGYIYDVASSQRQSDPIALKPDKVKALHPETGEPHKVKSRWVYELDSSGDPIVRSPGLSRSTSAGVPTWRYRKAILDHGLDPADYADHLLNIAPVDAKLYQRINGSSGAEVGARYSREIYGVAVQLSGWRRAAAKLTSQSERDLKFPRQPVCIAGYSCPWRGPCLQDGEMVRRNYDLAPVQRWVPDQLALPKTIEEEEKEFKW